MWDLFRWKGEREVAALVVAAACLVGMAVGSALTFALLTSQRAIPSTGLVVSVGFGVFSDEGCSQNLTSIDWGSVHPGESVSRVIYVKNTGNTPISLSIAANGWGRCRFFAGTLKLKEGEEFLVEIRVTPLDEEGT